MFVNIMDSRGIVMNSHIDDPHRRNASLSKSSTQSPKQSKKH